MYRQIVDPELKHELIDLMHTHYGVDIRTKSRRQEYVLARSIYYTLLREKKYGYASIAETLKMNHATVIHAVRSLKDHMSYDTRLREDYHLLKEGFFSSTKHNHPMFDYTRAELISKAKVLENQNKSLNLSVEQLKDSLTVYKKFDGIIRQLKERSLNEENLSLVSKKLNHILNGINS
jgi:hypothetical protein